MKTSLIFLALATLAAALPAHAVSSAPRSAGIEAKDYAWNKPSKEVVAALKQKGDIEKGKIAYEPCRGCHKADASGRPDAGYPQLAGQHATVLIKQMFDVRTGRRDNPRMHPFVEADAIPAQDIPDVAVYLNSLPVPTTNVKGDGKNLEQGKKLYDKDCASCHGKVGEGEAKKFYPKVAAQHYPYLYRETLDIRDKQRRNANPEMVKSLKGYSDDDIATVSDYMARMAPVQK
jgi:cytochrome c553